MWTKWNRLESVPLRSRSSQISSRVEGPNLWSSLTNKPGDTKTLWSPRWPSTQANLTNQMAPSWTVSTLTIRNYKINQKRNLEEQALPMTNNKIRDNHQGRILTPWLLLRQGLKPKTTSTMLHKSSLRLLIHSLDKHWILLAPIRQSVRMINNRHILPSLRSRKSRASFSWKS